MVRSFCRTLEDMSKMRSILKMMMESAGHNSYDVYRKTGLQPSTITRYLKGESGHLKPDSVVRLARLYGITESQLRGDVPIEGRDIPAAQHELKDLLPLDEYQFISNVKSMNADKRGILYRLAEILAEGSHAASPEKHLSNTEKSAFHPAGKKGGR